MQPGSCSSCSTRPPLPALPLRVEKEATSQDYTVMYCPPSTVVAGWAVGAFSSPTTAPCLLVQYRTVAIQLGTRCRTQPKRKSQPWSQRNSICTYGGTTDSYYVQYMHVCSFTRLTNGVVSSQYQIAYRGHSRQALVSNLLTFHSRFPRRPRSGHLSLSDAAVGFSTPTRLSTF